MRIRFQIRLDPNTFKALRALADNEFRDPRLQAALLVRDGLRQRGLIQDELAADGQPIANQPEPVKGEG